MPQIRSYFYSTVFDRFRNGKYVEAIDGIMRYNIRQSSAGFRRVYDVIIRSLMRVETLDLKNSKEEDIKRIQRELLRGIIIAEYQAGRKVLNDDLASGIEQAIKDIISALSNRRFDEARNLAAALRDSLDALLTFKIVSGRRAEEEEEEFL
ncbi:hypothetical protein [Vulcanisaeta thermophila]|uniref:hypothetical protein n=1 Tax=Vulcanisaeta thermophila TaxID=867917 RepID=UPI000852B625|nr:hypothetical protein [Vulcanisaeta thermophila]